MPNIGPMEIGIVLVIVLIIFGPKRLPELGKSLGAGMKEFKESVTGSHEDDESGAKVVAAQPEPVAAAEPADAPVSARTRP